jgi:RNA polymerase sigma factor (sigma-70 family)
MSESEQARWFAEEVQPHESALRAYLRARFPSLTDQDDVVQEAYSRLLQAKSSGHIRYAKAFLFTTARNVAIDFFRRRTSAPLDELTDSRETRVLEHKPNAAELLSQHQELEILADALQALPDRCRQVIMLRYLDGLAYKEIAVRLEISPETVKVHMANGMRRCAEYFLEHGLLKPEQPKPTASA